MGATPRDAGVMFRVWAPHARGVAVIGSFNGWDSARDPMNAEGDGTWSLGVAEASVGDEYKYLLTTDQGELSRIDPYAREVTGSVGNGIVHDTRFDGSRDDFQLPPRNELVIYELHVGTFNDADLDDGLPARFEAVTARLSHLRKLGVNAIQIMPIGEFAGDRSWGYNPAHIFAVELAYGGPAAFKRFVKRAHQHGIAVILDVVYSHLGPNDLAVWQFDGGFQNGLGGIYFYDDVRAETPWGPTRPDYGRSEVRRFIADNVCMWFDEYHVDGLRFDATKHIRSVGEPNDQHLPDGWSLLQQLNELVARRFPGRLTIAEDLQGDASLTQRVERGGAGFDTQWDADFVQTIRRAVLGTDAERSMAALRDALVHAFDGDAFSRVIYSESHDEVANGRNRVPEEVDPDDPNGWRAQKHSTLAAAMVLTAPGIPMIFQGQEFLEGGWFRDTAPLDWDRDDAFRGIVRLYRDLIRLRRNADGVTRGLCGASTQVHHVDERRNLIAFHRFDEGGPGDSVVVVANLHREPADVSIGMPAPGVWRLRLNSDWQGYSEGFDGHPSADVLAEPGELDGMPCGANVTIGAWSVLVFSQ